MSNINQMVEKSLQTYPAIFTTRGDFLHHILLTLESGYAWDNGEIVEQDEYKMPVWNKEEYLREEEQRLGAQRWELFKDQVIEEAETYHANIANIDNRTNYTMIHSTPHSMSGNNLYTTMPDNVTPEWKTEIEKFFHSKPKW